MINTCNIRSKVAEVYGGRIRPYCRSLTVCRDSYDKKCAHNFSYIWFTYIVTCKLYSLISSVVSKWAHDNIPDIANPTLFLFTGYKLFIINETIAMQLLPPYTFTK